jgi:hypothetical protein
MARLKAVPLSKARGATASEEMSFWLAERAILKYPLDNFIPLLNTEAATSVLAERESS